MHLRQRIERFLRRSGMSASRFGLEAARDPRFVSDLRQGRAPRALLERRVTAWLNKQEARRWRR
jgi:hypothetical protein